jgi:antitoxin Phd
VDAHWQVQEAKQRFSELVRRAQLDGVQFVTRHGAEVAVVLDIAEYRRLSEPPVDFKSYLAAIPSERDLDLERADDLPRDVDLSGVT